MRTNFLKSFILVVATALITVLIMQFFCKKHKNDHPKDDGTRSLTTICMDYDNEPPATLTTDLVKSMVTKYDGTQLRYIQTASNTIVREDAKAIWFDLETLKKFLYHIEHNVGKNYAEGHDKKLGVRIYYSAYPDASKMNDYMSQQNDTTYQFDPAYENLHTLVMIPTITGENDQNYDFNPLDKTTYNGFTGKSARNPITSPSYNTLSLGASSEVTNLNSPTHTSARNHGTLFPPGPPVGVAF